MSIEGKSIKLEHFVKAVVQSDSFNPQVVVQKPKRNAENVKSKMYRRFLHVENALLFY